DSDPRSSGTGPGRQLRAREPDKTSPAVAAQPGSQADPETAGANAATFVKPRRPRLIPGTPATPDFSISYCSNRASRLPWPPVCLIVRRDQAGRPVAVPTSPLTALSAGPAPHGSSSPHL